MRLPPRISIFWCWVIKSKLTSKTPSFPILASHGTCAPIFVGTTLQCAPAFVYRSASLSVSIYGTWNLMHNLCLKPVISAVFLCFPQRHNYTEHRRHPTEMKKKKLCGSLPYHIVLTVVDCQNWRRLLLEQFLSRIFFVDRANGSAACEAYD
jgi:hypothetical protein